MIWDRSMHYSCLLYWSYFWLATDAPHSALTYSNITSFSINLHGADKSKIKVPKWFLRQAIIFSDAYILHSICNISPHCIKPLTGTLKLVNVYFKILLSFNDVSKVFADETTLFKTADEIHLEINFWTFKVCGMIFKYVALLCCVYLVLQVWC